MTLQQLRYVMTVVECGSISEGAKKLYISQPSLSNAIHELEKEVGITIFNRSSRGITLSADGREFLSYAAQVVEQAKLLEDRYKTGKRKRQLFSVSTQHYAFAVSAFAKLVALVDSDEYEFTLCETRTNAIIEDVKTMHSEIGILYVNDFNEKVIFRLLKDNQLEFNPLFEAAPHVFVSENHPLAKEDSVTLKQLEDYPFLNFEQDSNNSFYFSEEILSMHYYKKQIHVSDRATLFNLLKSLNGYTISSGILGSDLNCDNISAVPLHENDRMIIGWISKSKVNLSDMAKKYISFLKDEIYSS